MIETCDPTFRYRPIISFHGYELDDLENAILNDKVFDLASFTHGYCQYLALAFAKRTNSKIIIWFDECEESNELVLCHAFNKIKPSKILYFDARGFTSDINKIQESFDYYGSIMQEYSYEDALKIFKEMKVPIDDDNIMKKAEEIVNFFLTPKKFKV